jgi:adenylate kinase
MQIIFLGPPASGKGTQSTLIVEKYNIPHISTGDILRKAIADHTPEGIIAERLINDGNFVPDDIMINIVKKRLSQKDCENGFLLDGFPRTLPQADALEKITKEINKPIELVINLVINQDELIERVIGRRSCGVCGASYHVKHNPPKKQGVCDLCGGELYQRADDNEQSIKVRLDTYDKQTSPLVHYYAEKGIVKDVNALDDIHVVFDNIQKIIGEK